MMNKIPATRQLVVNMTSASGGSEGFEERKSRRGLRRPSGNREKCYSVRPLLGRGVARSSADTDKNVVSALEAFRYAEQKTRSSTIDEAAGKLSIRRWRTRAKGGARSPSAGQDG